jgi:hypothetical protein
LERDSLCLGLSSGWLCRAACVAAVAEVAILVRFLGDFDIEILDSVSGAFTAALPKPHLGARAGGAGSQCALGAREVPSVPLESQPIASPFCSVFTANVDMWSHDKLSFRTLSEQNTNWTGVVRLRR